MEKIPGIRGTNKTYSLPHVKRHVYLKWGDPSLADSLYLRYVHYHALKDVLKEKKSFSWFIECFVEKEADVAQKVGHIELNFGLQHSNQIQVEGIWFDDVLHHATYLQSVKNLKQEKGCGLAASNTLLLFFESNPKLFPEMHSWTLADLSQVHGERVLSKIYLKLGFEVKEIDYDASCDLDPSTGKNVYAYYEDRARYLVYSVDKTHEQEKM